MYHSQSKAHFEQARKGFRPLSAIFVIISSENFLEFLWIFFEFFGNFLGGFFWRNYLGEIVWEKFFWEKCFRRNFLGGIFWEEFFGRNSLFTLLKFAKLFEYGRN